MADQDPAKPDRPSETSPRVGAPLTDDALAHIARARALKSKDEAIALYRDWAATYDRDVFERAGIVGSCRVADLLAEHVADRDTAVVDLGCGTGAVGAGLRDHGFTTVDGVDISPDMLAVARGKRLYRDLRVVDLAGPMILGTSTRYGAAVSAGTFLGGHVGVEAVPTIAMLLVSGGVLACGVAEPLWPQFQAALGPAGFAILRGDLEAIRPGGAPETVMLVARRVSTPQSPTP